MNREKVEMGHVGGIYDEGGLIIVFEDFSSVICRFLNFNLLLSLQS